MIEYFNLKLVKDMPCRVSANLTFDTTSSLQDINSAIAYRKVGGRLSIIGLDNCFPSISAEFAIDKRDNRQKMFYYSSYVIISVMILLYGLIFIYKRLLSDFHDAFQVEVFLS